MTKVNIQELLADMQAIQNNLLDFLEDENSDENFRNLLKSINDIKIRNDIREIKLFFHLLLKISNNHQRCTNFISKIEQVLLLFKDILTQNFSNSQIFNFFKGSKRILLFLVEENIITFDKDIAGEMEKDQLKKAQYAEYFFPEVKKFLSFDSKYLIKKFCNELKDEKFEEKRKIGENDSILCKMIREDSIDEFIIYVNQTNTPLTNSIKPSVFETNNFLLKKKEVSLIEYAAFFGSTQIFNYLKVNKVDLKSSLLFFSIHSKNAEMIHLLEECKVTPDDCSYKKCFDESIKCHHNDIANYFENNFVDEEKYDMCQSIKSYNFEFIRIESIDESSFYYLCQCDYYTIVSLILKTKNIDMNAIIVFLLFFFFYPVLN